MTIIRQAWDLALTVWREGNRMIARLLKKRGGPHAEIWLADYLRREASRPQWSRAPRPRHLIFSFVDHYEPHVGRVDDRTARRRLGAWLGRGPRGAARPRA